MIEEALVTEELTRQELAIFEALQGSTGYWRTTRELCEMSVGWPSTTLKSHICRMRKKLHGTGWTIHSRHGRGYRLIKPSQLQSWEPRISASPAFNGRVGAPEYFEARSKAFDDGEILDPVLQIELSPTRKPEFSRSERAHMHTILWLAFMAGSNWERKYRGRRYNDELTSVV